MAKSAQTSVSPKSSTLERIIHSCFFLFVLSLPTSMSGMELFGWLLTTSMAVYVWQRPNAFSLRNVPLLLPMLAFITLCCVGVVFSSATFQEKLYDIGRMRFFVCYVAVFAYFKVFPRSNTWLKLLFWACLIASVYGFFQHFIPLDLIRPEGKKAILYSIAETKTGLLVVGFFNHHLTFSNAFLSFAAIFFSLGVFLFPKKIHFLLLGVLIFVLCIWTHSRAAWAAVPLVACLIVLTRNRKLAIGLGIVCVGLLTLNYFTDSGFQERFDRTFFKKDAQYNLGPRARLWVTQWHMIQDHPWIGIGYNNNERQSKAYLDKLYPNAEIKFYGHAHSMLLQILTTTGILGFLAFVWLWIRIFSHGLTAIRKNQALEDRAIAVGLFAAMVGFQIQGITQWNFGDAEVAYGLMFLWALIARYSQHPSMAPAEKDTERDSTLMSQISPMPQPS